MTATPKEISKKYRLPPRKRLGQSFLKDFNIVRKIVELADLDPEDSVIEIGAGQGVMTRLIADRVKLVAALELDPALVRVLHDELRGRENVSIIHTDALKFDLSAAARDYQVSKIKVMGNIPYNISTPILFHLLEHRGVISSAVLMVQKEVAERIAAGPGTKDYGIPSIFTAVYARTSCAFTVPPTCFYPEPKVTSAVLKIDFRPLPLAAIEDEELFKDLVRLAFSNRRKTLMNNLRRSPRIALPEEHLHRIFEKLGLDPRIRGEALTPEQLIVLGNTLATESMEE
ncbi:MAG: 16S rRNA (adenine(1518)-N(6)/adenine(1519)-N(6))-dimethyltransferase RsmA [Syntrophales bacterium]|nr:16S rRNA (adenine(1518)-N(6)/adenine(1519)-N(6))-dimethyltransferase RsmA [Syntrophales bacterium]